MAEPIAPAAGAFSKEQGPVSVAAVVGGALGLAAAALVWNRNLALALGIPGVVASLAGLYQVATFARRGRMWARLGIGLGGLAAVASVMWHAQRVGAVDLTLVGSMFFRLSTMEVMWWPLLRTGLVNTIRLAFFAEMIAIVLGLMIATFRLSPNLVLRRFATVYIDVFRGTPLLVQLLVIAFALPFIGVTLQSRFTMAVVGLSLNSAAYVAEVFRAGIQSIERGQRDAARSLGMPESQTMLFVVIPQAVRRVIPPLLNEFIALIKDTSLVLVIGATVAERELLGVARSGATQFGNPTPYMMASVLYLSLTIPLTRVVDRVEHRLRRGLA